MSRLLKIPARPLLASLFALALIGGVAQAQVVPVEFTLTQDGFVTLVIETTDGVRVKNLFQNTLYSAGTHIYNWDGLDEGEALYTQGTDSSYVIDRKIVTPDTFRVRAISHSGIDLRYEFSVQSPGTPAWNTTDHSGGWLADHTPPLDIVALPAGTFDTVPTVQVVARVSETPDGLNYLTESGTKLFGVEDAGHSIKFFEASARDDGPAADPFYLTWHALNWKNRLKVAHTRSSDGETNKSHNTVVTNPGTIHGIVAHDNYVAVSYDGGIVFVDGTDGKNSNHVDISSILIAGVRGITTDGTFLYAVVNDEVRRYDVNFATGALTNPTTIVSGLDDPHRVKLIGSELFVSLQGATHQVRVFDLAGTLLRSIGTPGGPQVGLYDETMMSRPAGFDVDSQGKLWVAENAYIPKRISRWNAATGAFEMALYGPSKYGGGLLFDPVESRRAYYSGPSTGVIQFDVDWATGANVPERILHNREKSDLFKPATKKGTEAPFYVQVLNGERYFYSHLWSASHAGTHPNLTTWIERADTLAWIAAVGRIANWPGLFDDAVRYPQINSFVTSNFPDWGEVLYVWSDENEDNDISLDELGFHDFGESRKLRFYLDPELTIHMSDGSFLKASSFTAGGIPVYDAATLVVGDFVRTEVFAAIPYESGIVATSPVYSVADSMLITTYGPIEGYKNGERLWHYHSQWPRRIEGAPTSRFEGDLLRTTRVLGTPVTPPAGQSGPVWAINSDTGELYMLTTDGYFLETYMGDNRTTPRWSYPAGVIGRGDIIDGVTPWNEHFWPSLYNRPDGEVYLSAGKEHTSVLRLDGWQDVVRHDFGDLVVTPDMVGVGINVNAILEGAWAETAMTTALNSQGLIPLAHPFSDPAYNSLALFYEGADSVASVPTADVVDWVLVELRADSTAGSIVSQRAAFLSSDGSVDGIEGLATVFFPGVSHDSYYVVVRHRNHLPVMSASPVDCSSGSCSVDFTMSSASAFGLNALVELTNGKWGLAAGDANGNGQIQTDDKNDIWSVEVGAAGYRYSDFDLNGEVQTADKNVYWNPNSGRGSQVP